MASTNSTTNMSEDEKQYLWETVCVICGEKQGKDVCPFDTGYDGDDYICDNCPQHNICCSCGKAKYTGGVCDCGCSHREKCEECLNK
jgi:hypothetical protein